MFSVIAVAVDGSPHANAALATAIDLSKRYGSELVVVAVAPLAAVYVAPNQPFMTPVAPESATPQFRAIVDASVTTAKEAGVGTVTGVCYDGAAVDEILAHVENHPTDLLVVGSRGLSAAKRILLGSTSAALVTHAPCPVLVVRPAATKRSAP